MITRVTMICHGSVNKNVDYDADWGLYVDHENDDNDDGHLVR